MTTPQEINTAIVLSNATQLGVEVLMRLSRQNISGAIGGRSLTRAVAASLVSHTVREKVMAATARA